MLSVELAMAALSKLASTVVENQDLKSRTKWIAEVEINLMGKIFAVPKKGEGGKTVQQQEDELCDQCAAFIASKLLDLAKLGKRDVYQVGMSGLKRDSALVGLVFDHLGDPAVLCPAKRGANIRGDGAARAQSYRDGCRGEASN